MPDTDLFMELAGIAGVFVGFGALIAVRSGGAMEAHEVAPMRGVVMTGMLTIIAALVPVTLGRYDLAGHQVWVLSSVLVLVSYGGLAFIQFRSPEYRAMMATRRVGLGDAASALVTGGLLLALITIALGVAPELDAALYFTVVVIILVQAAWTLLWLVFMERRPQTASGPTELPATGGSSA